jgi:molecular chaperone DnaK (HSP70)
MATEQDPATGSMRLGIDFGMSTTVIAACAKDRDCCTLEYPGISQEFASEQGNPPVHAIPTLVEYQDGKAVWLGSEVLRGGSAAGPSTARWLRRYLCDRSPVQIPAGDGRGVRYEDAAADFLIPVLTLAISRYPGAPLVFTLPGDAPSSYRDLLRRIARTAGAPFCSMVDEYDAVLAGYCCSPAAGEPIIIITFSETDPEVVVLCRDDLSPPGTGAGGLRVLARAVGSTGCRALDTWIAQDLLVKFRLLESDPRAVRLMPQIRCEAALLREQLPVTGQKEVRLTDSVSGKTFTAVFTAEDIGRVLADHEVIPALQDCIGRALSSMRMRGGDESHVRSVLLLGTGCALPAVHEAVRSRFPGAVVHSDHLLDAAARGAALYAAPGPAQDRITRSYALRYWDAALQEHHYRFLVHSGTRFPSAGQVARIIISAAYDGQALLGIPLYEIGGTSEGSVPQIELVSATGGGVRLADPVKDADSAGQVVYANERSPTLLPAIPPAHRGEPRFECTFTVDADRNLCLSARDLLTGTLVKVNAPVLRLA